MRIGVLALQGAVTEHLAALTQLGVKAVEVRFKEDFENLDGLILPGGESTTLEKLMRRFDMTEPLRARVDDGLALWGTCAGMILLAEDISNAIRGQTGLGYLPIVVERNAFGRQNESCEAALKFKGLKGGTFPAVFIRAPAVVERKDSSVTVLAQFQGRPVGVLRGRIMATSFHPELTSDRRLHQFFLEQVVGGKLSSAKG